MRIPTRTLLYVNWKINQKNLQWIRNISFWFFDMFLPIPSWEWWIANFQLLENPFCLPHLEDVDQIRFSGVSSFIVRWGYFSNKLWFELDWDWICYFEEMWIYEEGILNAWHTFHLLFKMLSQVTKCQKFLQRMVQMVE